MNYPPIYIAQVATQRSYRSGGISQQIRGARLREELDAQSQQEQYHDPDR